MGAMRLIGALVIVVLLGACTAADPPIASRTPPSPAATSRPSSPASPSSLAAAEPAPPTLAQFRRQAKLACRAAGATIARAPLRGDPLSTSARPADVRAAIGYYRTSATAWATAAGQLWEFGLPERRAAEKLITTLDTIGQYSQRVAEFLQQGDQPSAQGALGAADSALQEANRIARVIGIGSLEDCGRTVTRLRDPQPQRVRATDFAFSVGAVPKGQVRFVLHNDGLEDHQLFVVPLRASGTLADAVREDRAGGRPGAFLAGEGVSSPVVRPGQRARLDVRLRPGPYGLVCFVASEDGTPHAYKGMATEIFVSR